MTRSAHITETCLGYSCDKCGTPVIAETSNAVGRAIYGMGLCEPCANAEIKAEFEWRTGGKVEEHPDWNAKPSPHPLRDGMLRAALVVLGAIAAVIVASLIRS